MREHPPISVIPVNRLPAASREGNIIAALSPYRRTSSRLALFLSHRLTRKSQLPAPAYRGMRQRAKETGSERRSNGGKSRAGARSSRVEGSGSRRATGRDQGCIAFSGGITPDACSSLCLRLRLRLRIQLPRPSATSRAKPIALLSALFACASAERRIERETSGQKRGSEQTDHATKPARENSEIEILRRPRSREMLVCRRAGGGGAGGRRLCWYAERVWS